MHNTSIIGWVKINALHIDTQVERIIVKRGGQANLGVKIFSGKCKIFPCVIFFPLVMLKIIIFSVVNKVVLKVKLDIRDPPTY